MQYKHKISRRLALLRDAILVAVAATALAACADEQAITGPGNDGTRTAVRADALSEDTKPGDRIQTIKRAYLREGPSALTKIIGTQPNRAIGTVIDGPVLDTKGDGQRRYLIDFETGTDGWADQRYLTNIAPLPVESVQLAPSPLAMLAGATETLSVTLRDANGDLLAGRPVTFASSDTTIATVSAAGVVLAHRVGEATVTARADQASGTTQVVVSAQTFAVGARVRATVTAYLRTEPTVQSELAGTQPAGALGTITAGPVVDTDGDGLIRWLIDFDSGVDGWGAEPYHEIVADAPAPVGVPYVTITPDPLALSEGDTARLSAVAHDASGAIVSGGTTTWISRDSLKVRVNSTGLVTAVAAGTAWVVGTQDALRDSVQVSVQQAAVATVTVAPATATLSVGGTIALSATLTSGSGLTLTGRSVSWTSSAASVATVSSSGAVTAVAAGTATVTATSEGRSGSAVITVLAPSAPTIRVGKYVAPNGSTGNDGTSAKPWPLSYALSGAGGRIVAGDTVWVRAGTYVGAFSSTLSGTSSRPVVVRAYPGERAVLEHAGSGLTTLSVKGSWSVFWGLEVRNPDPTRVTSSTASEERANGVVNAASNTKYINMIVHDVGVGFYNYTQYTNVEITGSIIYNNGWQGPDRGHGHALYIKSDNGPVLLKNNVMFNQFGYGVHVYTNAGSGKLNNIRIEGNTAFNNGALSTNSNSENILLGGADYSTGSAVVNNIAYHSPGRGGRNVRVGYGSLMNGAVTVTGNRIVGGSPVLDFGYWSSATVSGNTFAGTGQMVRLNNSSSSNGMSWQNNTQLRDPLATAWYASGSWRSFTSWRSTAGLGLSDAVSLPTAVAPQVTVRADAYEAGRALVTVYDPAKTGAVPVTLSGVLAFGDRYEVRSVQALFGAPLVSGTFGGTIVLPMGQVGPPAPIGMSSSAAPHTGAEFDAFVITRVP